MFQISETKLVDLVKDWMNNGAERFLSKTSNGNSVQEKLSEMAGESIPRVEIVEVFQMEALKGFKPKIRILRIVKDTDTYAASGTTIPVVDPRNPEEGDEGLHEHQEQRETVNAHFEDENDFR